MTIEAQTPEDFLQELEQERRTIRPLCHRRGCGRTAKVRDPATPWGARRRIAFCSDECRDRWEAWVYATHPETISELTSRRYRR